MCPYDRETKQSEPTQPHQDELEERALIHVTEKLLVKSSGLIVLLGLILVLLALTSMVVAVFNDLFQDATLNAGKRKRFLTLVPSKVLSTPKKKKKGGGRQGKVDAEERQTQRQTHNRDKRGRTRSQPIQSGMCLYHVCCMCSSKHTTHTRTRTRTHAHAHAHAQHAYLATCS